MMRKYLWKVGLVFFLAATFLNGVLVKLEIHGLAREGARLLSLIGLFVLLFGLASKFLTRKKKEN